MSDTQTTSAATDVAMLESLDPAGREVAVTSMLDQARQWLERAKESTTSAQDVAEFKAFVATVAEAAKQKKLSEEIQLDALEMVRRSERALGVAIRQGQDAGEIRAQGYNPKAHLQGVRGSISRESASDFHDDGKQSASEYFTNGQERQETYIMADQASDEEFERVIVAGREEGNLSRASVVAKVKDLASYRDQHEEKWTLIAEMAEQGYHSAQIAKSVGMTEQGVRKGAKDRGIILPADKLLSNTRRIDPLFVIEQIVLGLEVTETSLELVTFEGVTPEQAVEWLERLAKPLRALRQMSTALKEIK